MRNPIPRGFGNQKGSGPFHYSNSSTTGSNFKGANAGQNAQSEEKSDYCWNFNKGVPCKFLEIIASSLKGINIVTSHHMG